MNVKGGVARMELSHNMNTRRTDNQYYYLRLFITYGCRIFEGMELETYLINIYQRDDV